MVGGGVVWALSQHASQARWLGVLCPGRSLSRESCSIGGGGFRGGGCVQTGLYPGGDSNERAVRVLLECILVIVILSYNIFCPKLRGWRPCPVWQILDPPLLTYIFALTEYCILLPLILHRPPSGGFRILLEGGGGHQLRKWGNFAIFCRKLHKNERIWTRGRPWRPLGSANATDAYLELKSVIGLLCWPPWGRQVLHSMENRRNPLCAGDEAWKWDAGKPRVDITRVQNRGISGPRLGNPG